MKSVVFRNMDKYAISHLLKEIGRHALQKECRVQHLPFPKRVRLFYIECNDDCTFLKYKYQSGDRTVMKLDRYQLPETGWIRIKLQ